MFLAVCHEEPGDAVGSPGGVTVFSWARDLIWVFVWVQSLPLFLSTLPVFGPCPKGGLGSTNESLQPRSTFSKVLNKTGFFWIPRVCSANAVLDTTLCLASLPTPLEGKLNGNRAVYSVGSLVLRTGPGTQKVPMKSLVRREYSQSDGALAKSMCDFIFFRANI